MIFLSFCNENILSENQSIPEHAHNCHEVVFYSSNGTTRIGETEYDFFAGSVAVIPKNTKHTEQHKAATKVVFLGFDGVDNIRAGVYDHMWHIRPLFDDIMKEIKNQAPRYKEIVALKLCEIVEYIKREHHADDSPQRDLTYFKRYIEENYMHNITIKSMAKMAGYSYDHFRHLFCSRFAVSPQNYLIDIRIQKAITLLENTDLSCTEIACMCGFSDNAQFSKMIAKHCGMTPVKLRKQLQ